MPETATETTPARIRSAGLWFHDHAVLMESLADIELWGVPGGGLEPGESLTTACEREFLEETGVAVRCGRLAVVADSFFRDDRGELHHDVCFYFLVEPRFPGTAGRPGISSREAQLQFRWIDLHDLGSVRLVPDYLAALLPALRDHAAPVFLSFDCRATEG
ncbi:NUDIX hydrolase [Kitasatospora sp. NPDC001309]|uniref:NUDIX hydrolase n=1 Tax=Kitasatospora sp. NPDC001309 TaxID=3364013 RepID=UPI0036A6D52C